MSTKGDRTRRRILEVVVDLLEARSYEAMSIAEITRRAEVTRPAFYFHFASKGAAVAAVLEDLFDGLIDAAAAWYQHPGGDPLAGIPEAIEATVALWRTHARLMDAVARAASVDAEADRLLGAWVDELTSRAVDRLRRDIGAQMPGGGPPVDALASFMVGATFDAMRRDVRSIVDTGEPDSEVVATLTYAWTQVLGS